MRKRLILISVFVFIFIWVYSEGETAGVSFLKIGMGARAASLGDAYTALSDDATAIYWNPAGLAQLQHKELNFIHNEWFENINYETISFVYPFEDITIASSLNYLYTGKIEETTMSPPYKTGRVFEASDMALSIALAQKLQENLFIGIGFKSIYQKIEKEKDNGYAIDAGLFYKLSQAIKLGLTVQNLGSSIKFIKEETPLPTTYRIGLAANKRDFTLTTDISKSNDNKITLSSGFEVLFGNIVALRFGYRHKDSNKELGKFRNISTGLTGGFGINLKDSIVIDYGFVPYGELEDTHRISLLIKFGEREKRETGKKYLPKQGTNWRSDD